MEDVERETLLGRVALRSAGLELALHQAILAKFSQGNERSVMGQALRDLPAHKLVTLFERAYLDYPEIGDLVTKIRMVQKLRNTYLHSAEVFSFGNGKSPFERTLADRRVGRSLPIPGTAELEGLATKISEAAELVEYLHETRDFDYDRDKLEAALDEHYAKENERIARENGEGQ